MSNSLTINDIKTPTKKNKYTYRPSKKNNLFMEYWTTPDSGTFGNVYKSALKAGFKDTYARNLLNAAPKWLLSYIDKTDFTEEHIKISLQNLAQAAPDSRSPDDTRLKAIELLMKLHGLGDTKNNNNININVQPILAGDSMKTVENTVIDQ